MTALTSIRVVDAWRCKGEPSQHNSPAQAVLMDETPLVRVHHATSEKLFVRDL